MRCGIVPSMLTQIETHLPEGARTIARTLTEHGHRAWVVGGCIRDCLLRELLGYGKLPSDWDIATDATPEQVMRIFRRVVPTGIEHGTVTVLIDRVPFEVTTLRQESGYQDGRRPESVQFVTDIAEDLARRDFTVNAIAYDPQSGTLADPYGGVRDLRARLLRAVGEPTERFLEDGLRVLRAARFVATLGFQLEARTKAAIAPSLSSYRKVSAERIREEWLKAMKAQAPSQAFELMRETGILEITAPEMLESVGCEQNQFHAFDVWGHAMACLDACPASPVLRMAALLHDVGKPRSREFSAKTNDYTFYNHESIGAKMCEPMLQRLKFSNADRERIVGLVRHHLICYSEEWTDAAVRRWLRRVSPELAEDLYELGRADALGKGRDASADIARIEQLKERTQRLVAAGAALNTRDLAINGGDLISELGLRPGPEFKVILNQLLEEVTDEPSRNERSLLLARARELAPAREVT
jgi:tRNA nucleotidyltransferase (CCA-adding enzyme)